MTPYRLYHSLRLYFIRTAKKRAEYLRKHNILGGVGENCRWGPWLLPIYPKLIKLHNNVVVHKKALLVPHDTLNRFLQDACPETDFGHYEKIGCIELMDNVYIAANVTVTANVRINRNCIVSVGSVVTSDIPENTVASGIPAKPVGNFEMFAALRKMGKGQMVKFRCQYLSNALSDAEWEKFEKRRNKINSN